MAVVNNSVVDHVNERDNQLSRLKNSLEKDVETILIGDGIKACSKYLQTFTINELNEGFLKWLLPFIKKNLVKIFQENSKSLDTLDDEFVVVISKQNLVVAVALMKVVDEVLLHISHESILKIIDISCVPHIVIEILLEAFQHLFKSTDKYQFVLKEELMELFKITQTIHSSFFLIMNIPVVKEHVLVCSEESALINEVLDNLCGLSKIISKVTLKAWTINWRGYIDILNKYFLYVKDNFDIKIPLELVLSEMSWLMNSLSKKVVDDQAKASQFIKALCFQSKAILKIMDMFWRAVPSIFNLVLSFCLTIYNFSFENFLAIGLPVVADLVHSEIFPSIEPLIQNIIYEEVLIKNITVYKMELDINPASSVQFINTILRIICENQTVTAIQLDKMASVLFVYFRIWVLESYWDSSCTRGIFDNLVIHLCGVVLLHPQYYITLENIFLEYILGDNISCAILAIDCWTMILSYCSNEFCRRILMNLTYLECQLNFGVNTYRPEHIQLICLIKRVYDILPDNNKSEVVNNFVRRTHGTLWKTIGLKYVDERELPTLYKLVLNGIQKMGTEGFDTNSLKTLVVFSQALCSVDLNRNQVDSNITALSNAVARLWQVDYSKRYKNNVFRYFINTLCKLTGNLIRQFNVKQITMILNELKLLAKYDFYILALCDILEKLALLNLSDFGEDNSNKVIDLISDLIKAIYVSDNDVINEILLELLEDFQSSSKENYYMSLKAPADEHALIVLRLKEKKTILSNKKIFEQLKDIRYEHKCVQWKNVVNERNENKKFKPTEDDAIKSLKTSKRISSASAAQPQPSTSKKLSGTSFDSDDQGEDAIGEVIKNLKGNVKCLVKILKSDNLSRKQKSDLNVVARQLLSLID